MLLFRLKISDSGKEKAHSCIFNIQQITVFLNQKENKDTKNNKK